MKRTLINSSYFIGLCAALACVKPKSASWQWETLETIGQPVARHEAGLVSHDNKLYLMGGRRINPTSVYDPAKNTWTDKSKTPIELHHFQPVSFKKVIYIIGAMTGQWPNEKPIDKVIIYHPDSDTYEYGHTIPENRRRGGAGLAVYNNKIYVVGGITNGHMDGFKSWFDEYNPATGEWKTLEDAPNARDHFQAVVSDDKLYAFAGRNSSRLTGEDMSRTIRHGNVYNFKTHAWEAVTNKLAIPTKRAGDFAFAWKGQVIIGGGESANAELAQNEVEVFDTKSQTWSKWPNLNTGRHGSGFALIGDYLYTASGCGKPGGQPELTSIERLKLPAKLTLAKSPSLDNTPVHMQWHTVSLDFEGPQTSEEADENPFLNYRLTVEFSNKESKQIIRGFYAADGNAAETSAKKGAIWQMRFNPEKTGDWTYKATLRKGKNIALSTVLNEGESVEISNSTGKFIVVPSDKDGEDFRSKGRIIAHEGQFVFKESQKNWLKMGTNSPENLLAYIDFDGTSRMAVEASEGEATPSDKLHEYSDHQKDWNVGDPTWQNGKGKSIIGAMNYLASKGMNSDYFLTLNILGDGKDVWPYVDPEDFTRFDVSKLAQWEILFEHMQSKGILLHVVTQETENETMLDNGDTGPMRQLYFQELIARFGHHMGLVWNLGEENGTAPWSLNGQNDKQRKDMTKFLKENDPYNHPVLLHTHSEGKHRSDILDDILGFEYLDGLSLQQAKPIETAEVLAEWKQKSKEHGQKWLITMDEIGPWYQGAVSDIENPGHDSLRHFVLWGSLLSGGSGVEWYFGAKHPQNDLTSEDWRHRNQLWEITNHAKVFFDSYIPYWEMTPNHSLLKTKYAYCLAKENDVYAAYLPMNSERKIDLSNATGSFNLSWYDPLKGGILQSGSIKNLMGGDVQSLGNPPLNAIKDWVILIKREGAK
jgi:hypothetical protein